MAAPDDAECKSSNLVKGSGVLGLGFRGLGFGVSDLGFRVWGLLAGRDGGGRPRVEEECRIGGKGACRDSGGKH